MTPEEQKQLAERVDIVCRRWRNQQPSSKLKVLADEIGVSGTAVREWCTGESTIPLRQLVKLCRLTGESADWILGLKER